MSDDRSRPERPFWKPDVAKDVEPELESHLAMRRQEITAQGVSDREAREQAVRRFGDVDAIAATCRAIDEQWYRGQRRVSAWRDLRQDLGYGLRVLRSNPVALFTHPDIILFERSGDQFVWLRQTAAAVPLTRMNLVLNWFSELDRNIR